MKVLQFPSAYRQGERPYDIFKDRMSAISSIATGIKNMIANKYINNQLTMIADNILNKIDETKSVDLVSLITEKPPNEIYPDNLEDTVGQFIDKFAMGPMMQKEMMTGGLAPEGLPAPTTGLPAPTGLPAGVPPSVPETRVPTTSISQLHKTISGMPSGDINWANLYKEMSQKKPWFMGPTGPEDIVMQQMMGQIKDPKAKLEADIKLAKLVEETFYPGEAKRPGKYPYTEQEVKDYDLYKKSLEPPEEQIDFDKLNEFIEANDMKLSGVSVNPKTGNLSYSFSAKSTDKTWGEFLGEANEFVKLNPDYEITATNPKTGSVSIEKKGKPAGVTEAKPPTYTTAEKIEEGFMEKVETVQDFTTELNKLKGLNIDVSMYETTEYFANLMERKHRKMMDFVKFAFDKMTAGEEIYEKTGETYRELYKKYWDKANTYDQQYFMVTGKHLLEGK